MLCEGFQVKGNEIIIGLGTLRHCTFIIQHLRSSTPGALLDTETSNQAFNSQVRSLSNEEKVKVVCAMALLSLLLPKQQKNFIFLDPF